MGGDNIKVVQEKFRSFNELLYTLDNRKNNEIMSEKNASNTGDQWFTGTKNYSEAVKMLQTGYNEAAKMLQTNVKQKDKIQSKFQEEVSHPIPHTAITGFIPNVPNAIMNLPNSMISVDRKPQKRKTLSIYYAETGNADNELDFFIKAGSALLSAVNLVEKSGIQTRIDLCFFAGKAGTGKEEELTFPTVCIKNYGERYSFQKVSFPLVHPSMFRRIGFKWLETTPDITNANFNFGYGRSPSHEELVESLKLPANTYLLSTHWIDAHDNSVEEILKYLEVI